MDFKKTLELIQDGGSDTGSKQCIDLLVKICFFFIFSVFNLGSDYWVIRCSVVVFLVFVLYGHCFGIREWDIVSYAFPPYPFIFMSLSFTFHWYKLKLEKQIKVFSHFIDIS
jgi:hypothetical protein